MVKLIYYNYTTRASWTKVVAPSEANRIITTLSDEVDGHVVVGVKDILH